MPFWASITRVLPPPLILLSSTPRFSYLFRFFTPPRGSLSTAKPFTKSTSAKVGKLSKQDTWLSARAQRAWSWRACAFLELRDRPALFPLLPLCWVCIKVGLVFVFFLCLSLVGLGTKQTGEERDFVFVLFFLSACATIMSDFTWRACVQLTQHFEMPSFSKWALENVQLWFARSHYIFLIIYALVQRKRLD